MLKYWIYGLPGLIVALFLFLFFFRLGKDPNAHPLVRPNLYISESTILLSGKAFSAKTLKGHWSLIAVLSSQCHSCMLQLEVLQKIHHRYPFLSVYLIGWLEDPIEFERFIKKHYSQNDLTYILSDPSGNLGAELGLFGVPEIFLVDPKAKLLIHHQGLLEENIFEKNYAQHLPQA